MIFPTSENAIAFGQVRPEAARCVNRVYRHQQRNRRQKKKAPETSPSRKPLS
jgi:hypothetical protein